MKIAAISILALALVIGVVPQFTDCASQGRNLTMANGTIVPMKCHWTAMAEIALAAALGVVGVVMLRSRRAETKNSLSIVGGGLGALVALVPTYLIGVCANNSMLCNSMMKPTLVMSGLLVMAVFAVSLVNTVRSGGALETAA